MRANAWPISSKPAARAETADRHQALARRQGAALGREAQPCDDQSRVAADGVGSEVQVLAGAVRAGPGVAAERPRMPPNALLEAIGRGLLRLGGWRMVGAFPTSRARW